eukprot:CAMPEP_0119147602 /NCGR_PEP_ID=MMETSP1310-20130426/40604_1 /TAXON_ID=464262 /ORGANISM="Genus nov. species nov., Strain RCC2339" /LENGTH=97 /DNA_ID=CAMNT_0007139579 /DNA_START=49 /DNA_END=338 /DNA_ORIENTATION=+
MECVCTYQGMAAADPVFFPSELLGHELGEFLQEEEIRESQGMDADGDAGGGSSSGGAGRKSRKEEGTPQRSEALSDYRLRRGLGGRAGDDGDGEGSG